MKFKKIILKKEETSEVRGAPIGFSWTTFIFRWTPALCRGDWSTAIFMILISIILHEVTNTIFIHVVVINIFYLFMGFIYNKIYLQKLFKKGFYPTNEAQVEFLISEGITIERVVNNLDK